MYIVLLANHFELFALKIYANQWISIIPLIFRVFLLKMHENIKALRLQAAWLTGWPFQDVRS